MVENNVRRSFNRQQMIELLTDLNSELYEQDVQADIFLVGGGAMALAYDNQRVTTDLDAAFAPAKELREIIEKISHEKNLETDWLNDGAKGFLLGNDKEAKTVIELSNLQVQVPSPHYLLAMKTTSMRATDRKDIQKLAKICGFNTSEQVIKNALKYVPTPKMIPIAAKYKLQEMFSSDPKNISTNNSVISKNHGHGYSR